MSCSALSINKVEAKELTSQDLIDGLKKHVIELSHNIGERNFWFYQNLGKAADYIKEQFRSFGYEIDLETYLIDKKEFYNIIAVKKGKRNPDEIIIVGAHYDSVVGSLGADDNASGVAGLLELARLISQEQIDKTIKFIAFVNEEPPFFQTANMGSRVYAKSARKRKENIIAMISLEMLGFYNKNKNSQTYPLFLGLFYPDSADFIGFVSNFGSASLLNKLKIAFNKHSQFPLETLIAPSIITGVDWSDHSSFWKYGYKAIMVTDTSFYRYPYYHSPLDTYEKLDYESMSKVISGLFIAISDL